MKYVITFLLTLTHLISISQVFPTPGEYPDLQQTEDALITKPPNELKRFKFEIEYTPLSDIQPVFLFKTRKHNYWGMKILSSSIFFLSNEQTEDIFEEKNFWAFQTTIFASSKLSPAIEYSYSSHHDVFNFFYRKHLKNRREDYLDIGFFYNYSRPIAHSFNIQHFGFETSYFYKLTNSVFIGSSIQIGPHISNTIDGAFYSGFALNFSYLVFKFNIN